MQVEGAVALVSGGASGLGRATAEALGERGADVVVLDVPSQRERAEYAGLCFVGADVRDPDAVGEAVAVAAGRGPLRVVVNCAGIGPLGRVMRKGEPLPLEDFTVAIEVNLVGTFNVIRLAAAAMAANEPAGDSRGVIVNTASIAAFDGQIGQVAYAASKAGVAGMTLPLARDLASSLIRCVTIAPGLFDTPLMRHLPQQVVDSIASEIPHPSRLGDPAEYAALVVHITENEMLNGEVIRLDGAVRMSPR